MAFLICKKTRKCPAVSWAVTETTFIRRRRMSGPSRVGRGYTWGGGRNKEGQGWGSLEIPSNPPPCFPQPHPTKSEIEGGSLNLEITNGTLGEELVRARHTHTHTHTHKKAEGTLGRTIHDSISKVGHCTRSRFLRRVPFQLARNELGTTRNVLRTGWVAPPVKGCQELVTEKGQTLL